MAGQIESDNKRLDRLEAWQEIFKARMEQVEKLCEKINDIDLLRQGLEDYKELADERLDNIKTMFEQVNGNVEKNGKSVGKVNSRLLWLFGSMIFILLAAVLTVILRG